MTRVAVVGATGYAGAELVRILTGHPEVELSVVTSRQHADVKFSDVYPAMAGFVDQICEKYSIESISDQADFIFMALPHKLPMALVPDLVNRGKRVVDLSADFRFSDPGLYEIHYQPHSAPQLLKKSVYGLPEVYTDRIKDAVIIGNPGCYPTSVLIPLIPLINEGLIDTDTLIADSKSGVSGAGRALSLSTHHCEVNESFKAYKIAVHRHNPEMDDILTREAQKPVHITFVPHLVPMTRGMETTIYTRLTKSVELETIYDRFQRFYENRPFIRIRPDGKSANTLHVKGTNFCDIGLHMDMENQRLILTSAIDNLVKGAAGQAVQNMNIMLGLDETTGLNAVPFPL